MINMELKENKIKNSNIKSIISTGINNLIDHKIINFENSFNNDNSSIISIDDELNIDILNNKTKNCKFKKNDEDFLELEKLDRELSLKSNITNHPKNYGKLWTNNERDKILKLAKKKIFNENYEFFDESTINMIANKLERTEHAIREEIRKMIFNDYMDGMTYFNISNKFNIPESNIKLIITFYIKKHNTKIINMLEIENNLLRLKIDNIKLKKELCKISEI